jgi:hypothetical protein
MINRNTPRNSGALPSALSIKVYSDNKELNMQELFLLDYALTNPEGFNEPKELRSMRAQMKACRLATDHLTHEKLSPILPALNYEALRNGA